MDVPALLQEWVHEASDDALRAVVAGGHLQQMAVIVLAKLELQRREVHDE